MLKNPDIKRLTSMFLDGDHAGDKASHILRHGYFLYMNTVLVQRLSKKHFKEERQ